MNTPYTVELSTNLREVSQGQGPDHLACPGDPPRLALGSASWASRVVGPGDTAVLRCPVQGGHQLLYRWYKVSRDIIIITIIINTEYETKHTALQEGRELRAGLLPPDHRLGGQHQRRLTIRRFGRDKEGRYRSHVARAHTWLCRVTRGGVV